MGNRRSSPGSRRHDAPLERKDPTSVLAYDL